VDRFHYSWAAEADERLLLRVVEADEHRLLRVVGADRSPYRWEAEVDRSLHALGGGGGLLVLTNRPLLVHHLRSL
jgi:hypothetical protein